MRHLNHVAHRRDRTERIRDLSEGNDARARIEQLLIFVEQHVAAIIDRRDAQLGANLVAQHLPGNDVRVVLEIGDHHLIALADIAPAPGTRHEIDRFGRAASPDDGVIRRSVEETAHLLARGLEGVGRARRERVRCAMHVGILARIEIGDAVDHGLRLLRGRGVVEPDQRLAVDIFLQDREVAAEDMRVELPCSRKRWQRELWNMLRW